MPIIKIVLFYPSITYKFLIALFSKFGQCVEMEFNRMASKKNRKVTKKPKVFRAIKVSMYSIEDNKKRDYLEILIKYTELALKQESKWLEYQLARLKKELKMYEMEFAVYGK